MSIIVPSRYAQPIEPLLIVGSKWPCSSHIFDRYQDEVIATDIGQRVFSGIQAQHGLQLYQPLGSSDPDSRGYIRWGATDLSNHSDTLD